MSTVCIKLIDCHVKKFGYNEHPLITSSFFYIFLHGLIRTQRKYKFKYLEESTGGFVYIVSVDLVERRSDAKVVCGRIAVAL